MQSLPLVDVPFRPDHSEYLAREIVDARRRIAAIGTTTPLDTVILPSGRPLLVKREDLSKVHSFKWRGAANYIAAMVEQSRTGPVVTASAGNHAQGVALAAAHFGVSATIFMPVRTPMIKQREIVRLGGEHVRIVLDGNTYDDAAAAATKHAEKTGNEFVHAFNDQLVIAGQATIACEIVEQAEPVERVYVPVGGGGLAAGVASVLRAHWTKVELIGVEGEGQRSMHAAVTAQRPVELGNVDRFCDGTAVRRVGDLTYALCAPLIHRFASVSNDAVRDAVAFMWESRRCIPEPSGALGIASALCDDANTPGGDRTPWLTVLTGANIDLAMIPFVTQRGDRAP